MSPQRVRLPHATRKIMVVDAAAEVIARRGYDGTTVEEIVRAAGLQKGSIYNYISGKLDLLADIHDRCMHPTLVNARAACVENPDAVLRLRALGHVFMESLVNYNYHIRVVLHEWRKMAEHSRWPELLADRRELEDLVVSTLKAGARKGQFRKADHNIGALTFIGMLNYSYVWMSPENTSLDDARHIADVMVDTFVEGYAAKS